MLQSSRFYLCFIVWYTSNPVGHNKLGETVWRLCKEAGIQGRFTNHSLRATTATRGLQKGIVDKFVMARPDISTKLDISKAFECGSSLSECVAVEKDSKGSLKRSLPVDLRGSDTSEMMKSCPTDNVNNGKSRVVFEKCTFFCFQRFECILRTENV